MIVTVVLIMIMIIRLYLTAGNVMTSDQHLITSYDRQYERQQQTSVLCGRNVFEDKGIMLVEYMDFKP
jgi:hypothetical protein